MIKCSICNKEYKNLQGLSWHISKKHNVSKQEYYFTYYHSEYKNTGKCYCGKDTRFLNIIEGFKKYCSHKCANFINNKTSIRETLINRTEEQKQTQYERCKQTQENKSDEEKEKYRQKRIKIAKQYASVISKKRVETMNNWSQSKKDSYKEKLKQCWKNKTQTELNEKYKKQYETNINAKNWIPKKYKTEYELYRENVHKETNKWINKLYENWNGRDYYTDAILTTTKEYKKIYPNKHPNSNKNQPTIDHMISIQFGFINKIPIERIGNIKNLCITSRYNNSKKRHQQVTWLIERLTYENNERNSS